MSERSETLQRFGPVAGLPALLHELGVDPATVFAGSAIELELLNEEAQAPFSAVASLLERAADVAGCPHLGLLLGARYDHRVFGPVGRLMMVAPTLGDALKAYVGLQMAYSRGAVVYLSRLGSDYALGYGAYRHDFTGGGQLYGLGMAVACNAVRALTGGRVQPSEVHMSCRAPADAGPYRTIFGAPVLFNQVHTCIVLTRAALKTKIPSADRTEWARWSEQARLASLAGADDLPARVRHVLRPHLMHGTAGMADVARTLGTHPRTLARKLNKLSFSFERIRDEVRFAVARELLELTDMTVSQVSDALSFSSHSSFVHAFNRWSGMSPSQWRSMRSAAAGEEQPTGEEPTQSVCPVKAN